MVLHYTSSMKKILASLILLLASPAFADTCKYEDAEGRVIYSNMPMKGAKKIACFGSDGNSSRNGGSRSPRAAQTPTPASFPRVDSSTQKSRDDTRRSILQEELATEQKALEQAKKDYAEGEANPEVYRTAEGKTMRNMARFDEKMKKLQEGVDLHEKNIQMLQKELGNLK